jgi:hypothetical protein
MWGTRVEELLLATFRLGLACQEVQDSVAQGGVQTQGPSIVMGLEGTMVLNAEL